MGSYKQIPLRRKDGSIRAYAKVSPEDFERLNQWKWCLGSDSYAMRAAYIDAKWRATLMHREILGLKRGDGKKSDHRNRDKLDNRRENLRVVDTKTNARNVNSHRISSSQYRGVSWCKANSKWYAGACYDGKRMYLGYFACEEGAAAVVKEFWESKGELY